MDFNAWAWGWLWQSYSIRRAVVFLAQWELSPAWLVNGIWRHTPFGYALREMFLQEGQLEMAAEATRILERHCRGGLGRAVSGPR